MGKLMFTRRTMKLIGAMTGLIFLGLLVPLWKTVSREIGQTQLDAQFIHALENRDGRGMTYLLERGVSVDARGRDGRTALIAAYMLGWGNSPLPSRALALGADPNAQGLEGDTPLLWAAIFGDVDGMRNLLQRGADVNAKIQGKSLLAWFRGYRWGMQSWEPHDEAGKRRFRTTIRFLKQAGARE